uniref:Uncharacterized protein n=1 Tax=Oryza sativa subsp. japonica TaxID=39947 RepID=Q6H6L5_ORYSJ|nr:hypothetical protein [Oryza sativa Japonica Group]BAD27677.1 hypothetical protein [Oryza sativa Japonica Group]
MNGGGEGKGRGDGGVRSFIGGGGKGKGDGGVRRFVGGDMLEMGQCERKRRGEGSV